MFRRAPTTAAETVRIVVDGAPIDARAGDSVAAALLASGLVPTRESAVSKAPRAPYCMMGACFECLVIVDGLANRQGCLVEVRPGMTVETIRGRREVRS